MTKLGKIPTYYSDVCVPNRQVFKNNARTMSADHDKVTMPAVTAPQDDVDANNPDHPVFNNDNHYEVKD